MLEVQERVLKKWLVDTQSMLPTGFCCSFLLANKWYFMVLKRFVFMSSLIPKLSLAERTELIFAFFVAKLLAKLGLLSTLAPLGS